MTQETAAYIEEIANGNVPAINSPERIAYEKEMGITPDYTWAIQTYQAIRAEVQRGSFEDWDVATMKEMQ